MSLFGISEEESEDSLWILAKYGGLIIIWTHACIVTWANIRQKINHQITIPEGIPASEYSLEKFNLDKDCTTRFLIHRIKKDIIIALLMTTALVIQGVSKLWSMSMMITSDLLSIFNIGTGTVDPQKYVSPVLSKVFFHLFCGLIERIVMFYFELEEIKIEKHFGFSKISKKSWINTYTKSAIFKIVLMPFYLEGLVFVMQSIQKLMWNQNWLILSFLTILYFATFPALMVIAALSTAKLEPLPEGELKTDVNLLADLVDFPKDCIFIMQSRKARNHPNAFHVSFFFYQRLIIFESLIQKPEAEITTKSKGLTNDLVVAVVSHEFGHFKLNHGLWSVFYLQILRFTSTIISSWLITSPTLYKIFNFKNIGENVSSELLYPGLLIVNLFLINYILAGADCLYAIYQRQSENDADEYAVKLGFGPQLERALVKISADNYLYLDDDKFYTWVNCRHPSIVDRVKNIRQQTALANVN